MKKLIERKLYILTLNQSAGKTKIHQSSSDDVTGANDHLVVLKAKSNRDCLFNSISILLFGDENPVASDTDFFLDFLFTVALTRQGYKKKFLTQAFLACEVRAWSSWP